VGRGLFVVDLDRTLVKVDVLVEQLVVVLRTRPLDLLRATVSLVRGAGGRAAFKEVIAQAAGLDASHLPYRDAVLELIAAEHRRGARIVLASASHRSVVESVARHLGCFDHVLGSSTDNLKGRMKLAALRRQFPTESFAYVGDSMADRPLWSECSRAIAINPSAPLLRRLGSLAVPVTVLRDDVALPGLLVRQLRIHRWIRNLLALVPLIAAPLVPIVALRGVLAFMVLSCLSSAGYILNDLADLQADRRHPTKRSRPIASGDLSIGGAIALLALLGLGAASLAIFLPLGLAAAMLGFLAVNVAYSLWLKKLVMLDVVAVAALHTLRVVAGALAMSVEVSVWFLAFCVFLFLGLALLARFRETAHAELPGDAGAAAYRLEDLEVLFGIGMVMCLTSAPALLLYFESDGLREVYAARWPLLLVVLLLLYWISRHLILVHRHEMEDDAFAGVIRDRTTWYVAACALVLFLLGRV
jgi:4-hydroxybenzoate polyprenyltransferase/phosphoserine phosphatase